MIKHAVQRAHNRQAGQRLLMKSKKSLTGGLNHAGKVVLKKMKYSARHRENKSVPFFLF